MLCRITDLHDKEVIDIATGNRLGCVDDVEVDTCSAQVCAIVIRGRAKLLGLFGSEDDLVIPWREIEIVGDETVLVNHPELPRRHRKNRLINGIFTR
ncbi:MAG: YlmC/YmxH family sporulation protein [Clostridia bacterium]|nr:YlmC/YmxH family sporulation protein [Clostridia bacterium]